MNLKIGMRSEANEYSIVILSWTLPIYKGSGRIYRKETIESMYLSRCIKKKYYLFGILLQFRPNFNPQPQIK